MHRLGLSYNSFKIMSCFRPVFLSASLLSFSLLYFSFLIVWARKHIILCSLSHYNYKKENKRENKKESASSSSDSCARVSFISQVFTDRKIILEFMLWPHEKFTARESLKIFKVIKWNTNGTKTVESRGCHEHIKTSNVCHWGFPCPSILPQFLNNSVINSKYLVKSIEWTKKHQTWRQLNQMPKVKTPLGNGFWRYSYY